MTARRRALVGRDQRASTFSAVLLRLCDSVGAVGAALVDAEGETVDYAGGIDPFDIKIAAAEWVIVIALLRTSSVPSWPSTEQVVLRGTRKSFLIQMLEDGYAVVLQLPPHAFGISSRGVAEAVRDLCAEAGLELPRFVRREKEQWWRVDVRCEASDARRPNAIWASGGWCGLEILGRWQTPNTPREVGYRARLPSGAEITLVRERLGRWYTDSPLHGKRS